MEKLPNKTVERLSQYRRILMDTLSEKKRHIFSYEIANMVHNTPEQVRRDLMLIGYSSTLKKGYDIAELINLIGEILDTPKGINVCVIGMGHLGKAITNYFNVKREKMKIVAAFDTDSDKIDRVLAGVRCYHMSQLSEIIKASKISIGILTMPAEFAKSVTAELVHAGIKGILNYTTKPVNVPGHVYLEEYDMITSLEKVAYFAKDSR